MSASARQCSVEEAERKQLICERLPTGDLVVNKSKLATVVEAEGFCFVDATAHFPFPKEDFFTKRRKTMFLLTNTVMRKAIHSLRKDGFSRSAAGWCLLATRDVAIQTGAFPVTECTSQSAVVKWMHGENDHCAICYEPTNISSIVRVPVACKCGTTVCMNCLIDLILVGGTQLSYNCPNCRCEENPFTFLATLFKNILYFLKDGKGLDAISAEHLEFIKKITSVDLTLPCKLAAVQLRDVSREIIKVLKRNGIHETDEIPLELSATLYKDIQRYVDRKRKKKVASADDSSSAVAVRSKGGCANCAKQFWYKSEWRRAPKCLKCRRTAYCSAKCRKKHAKAHMAECRSGKGAKRKKKALKKPKKGGCAPH